MKTKKNLKFVFLYPEPQVYLEPTFIIIYTKSTELIHFTKR